MTHSDDWNDDMVLLDHDTADRLVRGAVAPDDAPPGYAEVAALLGELRDEPVVVDDSRLAEFTAAVQSSVAPRPRRLPLSFSRSRLGMHAGRSRRGVPAAIVGGVAIAMLVAPVAARIARDIDRSVSDEAPGAVVTPPADDAADKREPPRRPADPPAKQRSRAATTPAADRAAVTVPVASDAPPTPSTETPAPASKSRDETPGASTESKRVSEATEPTCEHGAEASAKDGRPCPGEKRQPVAEEGPPRGGPER